MAVKKPFYFWLFLVGFTFWLFSTLEALSLISRCQTTNVCTANSNKTFKIETRDGQSLDTLIFFPWANNYNLRKRYSTILVLTPYGNRDRSIPIVPKFLLSCYVVVVQDLRGRYGSTGNYTFLETDANDAFDTMKWIQSQPWSNRKIFSYGVSADGISSYLEPRARPRWLKGQFILEATAEVHTSFFRGGSLDTDLLYYFNYIGAEYLIPSILEHEADGFFWNLTRDMNSYWNDPSVELYPSVHYGGWYDVFQKQTLRAFEAYRKKTFAWLVFGPYGHCSTGGDLTVFNTTWELEYALNISLTLFGEISKRESLCPSCIRRKLSSFPPILLFVMGPDTPSSKGNFYKSFSNWPSSEELSFYLHNSSLKLQPYESNASSSFVYNPDDPAPTIGGTNLFLACGPRDQRPLLNRSDVLVFTSDYFDQDFAVTGNAFLSLYVSSDRNDTDFVAKVTDLYPDGRSELLLEGIIRMKWRNNPAVPSLMVPGNVYHVTIDLWSTSYIFNQGHRIQLFITSSSYPKYSINPNNARLLSEGGPNLVALNSIYYGGQYPSKLILPKVRIDDLLT